MLFNKRFAALFCSVFLLTAILCRNVIVTVKLFLALIAIPVFVTAFFNRSKQKKYLLCISLSVVLSVFVSVLYFDVYIKKTESYGNGKHTIEAVLLDSETANDHIIRIKNIDGKAVNIKAAYHTDFNIYFDCYTVFTTDAELSSIDEYSDDGFRLRDYYMSRGILLKGETSEKVYETKKTSGKPLEYYIGKLKEHASGVFERYLPDDAANLTEALVLGKRDRIDSQTKYQFRNLGISHILAISGMHFGILIGGLDFILSRLSINKILRNIIDMSIAVFYLFLVGFTPSVTRSAIMLIMLFISFNAGRKNDSVTSLLLAVFMICLINPPSIIDPGLMLSFTATLGMVTMASPSVSKLKTKLTERNFPLRNIIMAVASPVILCISAIMFSLPVTWYYYGEISVITPLSNLLYALPTTLLLYTAPLVILFSFFPFVASCIGIVTTFCADLMLSLAETLSQNNYLVSLESGFSFYIIILIILTYVLLGSFRVKNRLYYYLTFALGMVAFCLCLSIAGNISANKTETVYITHDNTAAFLITDGGKAMLCDFSDKSNSAVQKGKSMLKNYGLTELDSYLMTECNKYTFRTFINTVSSVRVSKLFIPDTAKDSSSISMPLLEDECKKHNIEIIYYNTSYAKHDGRINFGSTSLRISDISGENELKSEHLIAEITQNGKNIMYVGGKVFNSLLGYTVVNERYDYISALVFGNTGKLYGRSDYIPLLFDSDIPLIFPSKALFYYYSDTVNTNKAHTVENDVYILK